MNRKYDREELLSVMVKLRGLKRNDGVSLSVGADMIVGFPGETQRDHEQSLEIIREYGVHKLHAFPFSAHVSAHSVPAARLK